MSSRLVFLLEEPSMKDLLESWMPRQFPGVEFLCIPHQGKSDLDKSIPRKLAAWQIPGDRFIIVRDNDGADCLAVKQRIHSLCKARPDTLIRLVCQELEGWYLGDLAALAAAYPDSKVDTPKLRKRFSDPDQWQKPSHEVERLVPEFQKRQAARKMGEQLDRDRNTSSSYLIFVAGIQRVVNQA